MSKIDTSISQLRKSGVKPRFHGNGFVQLYLGPRTRLHIWTPELPPIRNHNATIHTHRYTIESAVIAGVLRHATYNVRPTVKDQRTCRVVQLTGASETDRKMPGEILPMNYEHQVRHDYLFAAGSKYNFRADLFHSSDNGHHKMTVTVMKKISEDARDFNGEPVYAKILLVGDEDQPTHAFDPRTQPTQDILWSIVERVVRQYHVEIEEAMKDTS